MTPLFKRVLTAVLLLAVFLPVILWAPAWLWSILVAGVVGVAAHEWARLSHFPQLSARIYAGLLTLTALILPSLVAMNWPAYQAALVLLAIGFWLLVAPLWLLGRWRAEQPFVRAVVGVVVLLPTWAALLYLQGRGPAILIGVLAIVWIADTAAYFSGRHFGRHKLAPSISPGKTWEGAAGALAGALAYAIICAALVPQLEAGIAGGRAWGAYLAAVAVLCVASIVGDLFESAAKRQAGVKDSGTILPGHGGILDRIDSATSTLPLAAVLWPVAAMAGN